MRGINQSWGDFQKEHFKWRHGRLPGPGEMSPNEGKLPSPSGWQLVWDWVSGLVLGGPGLPEESIKLPVYRTATIPEVVLRPDEAEWLFAEPSDSESLTNTTNQSSIGRLWSSSMKSKQSPASLASDPESFELKNLDTQSLTSRFNIYYQPGKSPEYAQIDGKWYATAEESGQRFVYMPGEDDIASTWPLRQDNGQWRFAALDEQPGRPILSVERIPSSYRVVVPTDLQEADAQGIYRAAGQEYIKIDGLLYRSEQDGTGRYIRDSNPSHRIAVQRSDQGWALTPPSRGLGGEAEAPTETIKDIFDITTERARAFLSQYRFDTKGPYTERNFVRQLNNTFEIPGWAARFRVREDASSLPAIPGNVSQPAPPGGMDVINPISGQPIHIDEGGYLNWAGFIERQDVPQVYRAIDRVNAGRNNPTKVGFHKSYRFDVVPKMIRGEGVIASADRHGPDVMFELRKKSLDDYAIYRINTQGLKSVSLRENIKNNPGVMERVFNIPRGALSQINLIRNESLRASLLDDFTGKAYSANEVHVDNEHLDPSRVTFERGSITYNIPWSADSSSTRRTPSEAKLQVLLDKQNATPGSAPAFRTVEELKSRDFVIKRNVYRAHVGEASHGLRRAPGAHASGDDYLAAIIMHTARSGGSAGEVLSLSNKMAVSMRYQAQSNGQAELFIIDTTPDRKAFRTVIDIILNAGSRLVDEGKITPATLLKAVDNVNLGEQEVFYVGENGSGDIPADWVEHVQWAPVQGASPGGTKTSPSTTTIPSKSLPRIG
jgi:hypothetical protein